MNTETYIVACETLKPELTWVMNARQCEYPIAWVESGKHVWPDKLRGYIQERIDAIPSSYKRILLVFGFCGNSMVGIKARTQTLVLPRVADCIPLFLGSQAVRGSYGVNTYFFTEGYLHSETSFITEFDACLKKYGKKRGTSLIKQMLEHYKTVAVIDTGTYNVPAVAAEVRPFAEALDLSVSIIPGNLRLFDALLAGEWNQDEFLVVPPGDTITLNDSLSVGELPNTKA
jgi:hypothetical protein